MRRREVASASGPAAVAIAGNANAPVTTYNIGTLALGQSSLPLTTAAKDPRSVFAAVDVAAFTGREWLSAGVDQFIAGRPHGYVFIEAEAGLGKTAFAAWLVRTRGYLSHFSRYSGGSSVQAALANLSAQLILRFSMNDQAPGGMLPEWAQNPSGFESLLAVAADQASGQGEPIVLVVDGLDEAETSPGSLPFGLPLLLPDGVYVVATYRTGRAPGRPDAPNTTIRIAKDDKRNEQDIHVFLDKAAREDVVAARLAEAGMDPAIFISLLGRRCGGVWIYLRYVLYELRSGLRRPDEIRDLPSDLSDYYAAQISRWRQDPAWDLGLDRLLATLGVAREALSAESLARLTGNVDHASLRRWCDLIVRPMLTATRANNSKTLTRYEIYHASFREFLNAGNDDLSASGEPQPDESLALAEELQKATLRAHTRICDAYLSFFGGLQNGLPALAENLEAGGIDDGYPLRHLAHHLCCAGRVYDLHALLAVEHSDAGGTPVNTWFTAHDFAGSINNYLDDLGMARDESAAATDQDIARGKPASSLGMEIRYILMMASIASYTANISTGLLRQLVHTGMWSSRRGLDHSRRITDPRAQLDALLVIRSEVAAEEHPAILAQALTVIPAIPDSRGFLSNSGRADALKVLAPLLPTSLLAQALTIAIDILADAGGMEALVALALHLPSGLLAQALTAFANDSERARVLTRLAPHLPPDPLAQALAAATAISDDSDRARALTGLAPHLPPDQQPAVVAQALAAATAIRDDSVRARALTDLAPHLPPDQQSAVVARALAAATAIRDDHSRTWALIGLAPLLPPDLLARALTAATAIRDDFDRARALTALVPRLSPDQQSAVAAQALTTAIAIRNGFYRTWALDNVTSVLHLDHFLPADLARALTAVIANPSVVTHDRSSRARVVDDLASHLPSELLAQPLAAATANRDGFYRAPALTALAPHLPPDLLVKALTAASDIRDDFDRAETLTGLAPHLPPDLLARALTIATAIRDDSHRARALTGLAPHLPPDLLARALAAAFDIRDDSARARALTVLVPHLPPDQQPAVLAQAFAAATAIRDDFDRVEALTGLAPHLPPDLLAQALTAATAISKEYARARALTGLAPHLPPDLLAQALTAATAISKESDRARALTDLAPLLPPDLLILAFAAATVIRDNSGRADALTGLAPHLPPDLLASALEAAPKNSTETLTALLKRSRLVYPNDKHATYIKLFRKSTCGADRSVCFDILAECSPIISEIGGTRSIEQCVHAVIDVGRWWP